MNRVLATAAALTLATIPAAIAFDSEVQAIIDRSKPGKLIRMADIATLMQQSQKWCYDNQGGSCAWTDIYFDVTETGTSMEIGNAWDADRDIFITDTGTFKDNRYICESGVDWLPTTRATRRDDASMLHGRDLATLKAEIAQVHDTSVVSCFDYVFVGADSDSDIITLTQRQYIDDQRQDDRDVAVTLHFDADDAAGLTLRWQ